ncbi:conserved hypothetical protein [Teredinibacter turnerae T7901]|uniref:DUF4124 domain-containing protein n=1 Tax=Teredinibacter turnerae (strain ATCC 39867 / T7901) TaxID=377629 RepID=C5BJ20_TERTT|nr:DUF4124 domain-containing protein [Teredinibacter turnerae]ACR12279.1 conserved hypothetical protein [Teredinibacter turnerae T7901]
MPMTIFTLASFVTACLITVAASAQTIYKSVDQYGNVTYSDEPPTNATAEKLELKPLNTTPAITPAPAPSPPLVSPAPSPSPEPDATTSPPKQASGYGLRLVTPKSEQRFGPAEKALTVVMLTQRKLEPGLRFEVYIDGKVQETTDSNNVSIALSKALQGRRSVSAAVVDGAGNVIERTEERTIFVIRPAGHS